MALYLKSLQGLKADVSVADLRTTIETAQVSMEALVKTNEANLDKKAQEEEKAIEAEDAKKALPTNTVAEVPAPVVAEPVPDKGKKKGKSSKKASKPKKPTRSKEAEKAFKAHAKLRSEDRDNRGSAYGEIMDHVKKALSSLNAKKETDDKKRSKALSHLKKLGVMAPALAAGGSMKDMQTVLSIETYKAGFVPQVSAAMKNGDQVVLNLYNHFVRLQSLDDDGFTVDDPGRYKSESMHVSWAKGIADGYFRGYTIVKP